jgi:hypothetical protein
LREDAFTLQTIFCKAKEIVDYVWYISGFSHYITVNYY